jgi:hypothetical protein
VLHDVGGVIVQLDGARVDPAADVAVASGQPGPGQVGGGRDAVDAIAEVVRGFPLASQMLVEVLRATEVLPVEHGLVTESLAYSALLTGREFGAWLAARGPRPLPPTGDEPVLLERNGDELLITLNRPERHNAFAAAMRDALVDALEVGLADPLLRVRLRGAGQAFSTGGDLDEFGTTPSPATAHEIRLERSPGRLLDALGDRVTVEVHGACIGAGVELAAFGHRVVARRHTFFQLPEVAMGLIPGAGGTVSVTRRIGRHRTAWLALSGERIGVPTALDWGLVDERC